MRHAVAFLGLALLATPAAAEDLTHSKGWPGYFVSDDCDADACPAYTFQVTQKFVRLPIKRQMLAAKTICAKLVKLVDDYEYDDGRPMVLQSCIFQYHGEDIIYRGTDGGIYAEGDYIAALAALRD